MNENQIPTPNMPRTEVKPNVQPTTVVQNTTEQNANTVPTSQVTPVISQTSVMPTKNIKKEVVIEKHTFKEFFSDIIKYITTRNSNELLSLLWKLVLVAAFVLLLAVPFQLVRDSGTDILISFGVNFDQNGLGMWILVWNLLYALVGVILFFYLCKDRFYKHTKNQEEIKNLEANIQNQ